MLEIGLTKTVGTASVPTLPPAIKIIFVKKLLFVNKY